MRRLLLLFYLNKCHNVNGIDCGMHITAHRVQSLSVCLFRIETNELKRSDMTINHHLHNFIGIIIYEPVFVVMDVVN